MWFKKHTHFCLFAAAFSSSFGLSGVYDCLVSIFLMAALSLSCSSSICTILSLVSVDCFLIQVGIFMVFFMCQVILDCVLDILTITLTSSLVRFYGECCYLCFSRHLTWLGLSCTFSPLLWPVVPVSSQFPQPLRCCIRDPAFSLGPGCWSPHWLSDQSPSMLIKVRPSPTWRGGRSQTD